MAVGQLPSRKDQIYETAAELFSRRGYHAATIRDIARELQIEGGSLYSHITSKQDLLYEIVLRAGEQFLTVAREVLAGTASPREQLRDLMCRHLALVGQSTARAAVYFHEWRHLDPERQITIKHHRDEYEGYVRRIIRAGVEAGEFATADERLAGIQVLSLLNWSYQWFRPDGALTPEDLADHFFELVMCGLEPRGPGAADPGGGADG